jgi:hypothetical protein
MPRRHTNRQLKLETPEVSVEKERVVSRSFSCLVGGVTKGVSRSDKKRQNLNFSEVWQVKIQSSRST